MAPLPHDSASRLEAGRSKALGEKSSSGANFINSSSTPGRADPTRAPAERMSAAGRLLLTILLSLLVTFGLASALSPGDWHHRPGQQGEDVVRQDVRESAGDGAPFTSLLEAASPNSLHELLHKYFPERFKDGVWETDASAVEAVRRVDAALATSIVQLAKRADNGTATTPSTTTPTPTPPPASSTPPPNDGSSTDTPPPTSSVPPPPSSSPPGQSSTPSTSRTEPSSSTPPSSSATMTTSRSTTPPGTSSSADTTEPSSSPLASSSPTSSPPTSSSTHGSTLVTASHSAPLTTASIARGGTPSPTTSKPTNSPSPSHSRPVTSTFTSTMNNGGVVIVTTTSWVLADPVVTGSSSVRPSPTLQNAAPAGQNHAPGAWFGVVVGAVLLT